MADNVLATNWKVDGETVNYALDEHTTLYVTKNEKGIVIKVKMNVPIIGSTDILYVKSISNGQLGHEYTKGNNE